ncbi:unnamed protein product, partial [Prorocentrum cordatum]
AARGPLGVLRLRRQGLHFGERMQGAEALRAQRLAGGAPAAVRSPSAFAPAQPPQGWPRAAPLGRRRAAERLRTAEEGVGRHFAPSAEGSGVPVVRPLHQLLVGPGAVPAGAPGGPQQRGRHLRAVAAALPRPVPHGAGARGHGRVRVRPPGMAPPRHADREQGPLGGPGRQLREDRPRPARRRQGPVQQGEAGRRQLGPRRFGRQQGPAGPREPASARTRG